MNLVDLLAPKMPNLKQALAEVAEVAENQQPWGLRYPPPLAESGGETQSVHVIRPNPPPLAETGTRATTAFPPNPPNPPPIKSISAISQPVTREYFATKGVNLLPEDFAFLRWHLPKDTAGRNKAMRRYIAIWLDAAASEPLGHKRDNIGRFEANTWLRGYQE